MDIKTNCVGCSTSFPFTTLCQDCDVFRSEESGACMKCGTLSLDALFIHRVSSIGGPGNEIFEVFVCPSESVRVPSLEEKRPGEVRPRPCPSVFKTSSGTQVICK